MATVQEIYNEIDRIDNAKSGIAGAIEEKGVEVPAGAKIDEYPELVRQIQQGDTSDCVKFTPQTLTEEQKAQARENIGAGSGKMGVISQTQTWSGTGSNPRTYVMSGQVTGLIPQANIDLFEAAGAVFNATSGYFELNGLTDISYEEMSVIYSQTFPASSPSRNKSYALSGSGLTARTNIPINRPGGLSSSQVSISFDGLCFLNNKIESCALLTLKAQSSLSDTFNGCTYLKRIELLDIASSTTMSRAINNCYSLEHLRLTKLAASVEIKQSPRLSAESVAYLITNAGTATITITLHATAYSRAIADASVQAALQSKTNVSLASA